MLVTKEEALEKWCPHAFILTRLSWGVPQESDGITQNPTAPHVYHHGVGPSNRGTMMKQPYADVCNCVADKCMQWRWRWELAPKGDPTDPETQYEAVNIGKGFCGLAGRPEE